MTTPTHYQPTGAGPTPWDLQKTMQTSGSCFVDARRTDAIEYCYRVKGDMLGDLRKARHCIDEAISCIEQGMPMQAKEPPYIKGAPIGQSSYRRRISRVIPDGCTAHRVGVGVEFHRGGKVVHRWTPALLKAVHQPRAGKGEARPRAEMTVFAITKEEECP